MKGRDYCYTQWNSMRTSTCGLHSRSAVPFQRVFTALFRADPSATGDGVPIIRGSLLLSKLEFTSSLYSYRGQESSLWAPLGLARPPTDLLRDQDSNVGSARAEQCARSSAIKRAPRAGTAAGQGDGDTLGRASPQTAKDAAARRRGRLGASTKQCQGSPAPRGHAAAAP